jgi:hypothetical protein
VSFSQAVDNVFSGNTFVNPVTGVLDPNMLLAVSGATGVASRVQVSNESSLPVKLDAYSTATFSDALGRAFRIGASIYPSTTVTPSGSTLTLTGSMLGGTKQTITTLPLAVTVPSSAVTVQPLVWTPTTQQFSVRAATAGLSVVLQIGGRTPGASYDVHRDGNLLTTLAAAANGHFTISDELNTTRAAQYQVVAAGAPVAPVLGGFTLTGYPANTTAGVSNQFVLTAVDTTGAPLTGYTGTVQFTSSDGQAVIPASYTFTAANAGKFAFSATLATAGAQTLTATDQATGINQSLSATVAPAAVTKFTVSGLPLHFAAGTTNSMFVTAEDKFGNTVPGYVGTVHFSSSDPAAVLPANYTFTAGDAGTHSFNVTLKTVNASTTVTATDMASGVTGTKTVQVVPAGPVFGGFTLTGNPASTTAGGGSQFVLTAVDTTGASLLGYTGTVQFTSTDGQAVIPATYTYTGATHTFGVTFKTAGPQTLTATDQTTGISQSFSVAVAPAAAKTFSVTGLPSPDTANTLQSIVVTALDAYGNTASGYLGTVSFSSSDPAAVLPANYTFTAADAGSHTFNVTLNTTGTSRSVIVTDLATGDKGNEVVAVTRGPAVLGGFTLAEYPASTTAGVVNQFVLTAVDTTGAVMSGYTGTVQFTSSDGQTALPASYTFTAANGGVHTFSATFKTAGPQTLTATDQATGISQSLGTTVTAAAVKTFSVTGLPSPDKAGTAQSMLVTALDAYGNTVTGYLGTVTFTSSDPAAVLPANYTFTSADNGAHSFNVTFETSGTSRSVTVTDLASGAKGSAAVQVTTPVSLTGLVKGKKTILVS